MAAIINKAFGGERPIVQPRLLNDSEAQLARNVRLVSGRIEPLKGPTTLKALTNALATTIFRYGNSDTETNYWLEWTDYVHAVRSPIANDQYDRVYWTGENHGNVSTGYPRYAPNSLVLSGASYPGGSYRLGLPKPANTITASGSAVVNATTVKREYVITYTDGTTPTKESLPSREYSVTGVDGGDVVFTNLPDSNEGDTRVTHKRIYRKLSGTYRLVTSLALAEQTYTDNMTDATLANQSALSATLANAIASPSTAPRATAATGAGTVETTETRVYQVTLINGSYTDGNNETVTFAQSYPSTEYSNIGVYQNQSATISVTIPAGIDYTHVCLYRKRGTETVPTLVNQVAKGATPTTATITDNPAITGTTAITANAPNPPSIDSSKKPTISSLTLQSPYTPSSSAQNRVYAVTYANASNNESPPSADSNVVTVVDGASVTISHVDALPTGVTVKRLYRKQQTEANSAYRRVTEVTASQTTFPADTATASSISGNPSIPAAFQNLLSKPTETPTIEGKIPAKKVPESRTYVYTYVSAYGEEGPPSAASTVIDIDPDQSVSLSNMSAAPTGAYNVTHKRIYRSSTVGNQAQFQFVAEIAVANATYTDTKSQSDLGEVLPSEGWEAPPAKLFNLRIMANGIACGFVKDDVCRTVVLSEPYLPHAWNPEYSFTTDDTIVGIGVFRQSIAVLTKSFPYILYGVDPAAMSMTKLELQQACVSAKSIVETGDGVLYASPDGLISISGNGVQNITQNIFTRDQWQEFNPSSMKCFFHDGRIHILYTTAASARGTLIMDLSGQGAVLTQSDIQTSPNSEIVGGYYDPRTDTLYWIQGGNIVRHNRGSDLTYLWRSKLYAAVFPMNFSCAQVQAETYPVTLKVYAGGVLKLTKSVANSNIFTLPSGFRASDWYYEVTGTAKVYGVSIAQSPLEIKAT